MRFLGIDYGMKRIGLAVSDENQTLAFPKEVLQNDSNAFNRLEEVIKKEKITEIVVGESTNLDGSNNPLEVRITVFITELERRFNLPVRKQKEFLTTVEARRSPDAKSESNKSQASTRVKKKTQESADSGAAALILQRYLDRINLNKTQ